MAKQVFEGLKVAEFAWVGVGPMVARELAEHGATVVRVESHARLDSTRTMAPFKDGKPGLNRSAMFTQFNTNKYGISLDLNNPKSKEVARRLVSWADVISDSMTPGTMAKWGLDYESCRNINPRVIYFSTTQQGQYGPHSTFQGFGHHANAMFGASYATGWPDGEPTLPVTAYADFIAPWYLTIAVIGALMWRHRIGRGMCIEQSQMEAGIGFMAMHLLDDEVNGHVVGRMGNRDRYMAPHGVYACRGADRWIAIAVADEHQWQQFCRVMGRPEWNSDPKFATSLGRKNNEDELDAAIATWTRNYTAEQVMAMMQDAGIPAGVVQTGEDLFNDPQLKHRRHYRVLNHPEMGPHYYRAPAYYLSKTPCALVRPGPCIGEHNLLVYKEFLGFTDDEIADMIAEGVITTEAVLRSWVGR